MQIYMYFSFSSIYFFIHILHKDLPIWLHLLKKPLIEYFIFCAVIFNANITITQIN